MSQELHQRITGHTELLALLAHPIRHSSSPRMHNLALTKLGLDYAYLCFEVDGDNLADAVRALRTLKVRGANVSMPNKITVLEYCDEVSPAARIVGACNTIVNDGGTLTAHITDGVGAVAALEAHGVTVAGSRLTIIGAGGAATAIAVQAALDGAAAIHLYNARDAFWSNAEATVQKIDAATDAAVTLHELGDDDALRASLAESAALIDATSVGMKPLEGETSIPDVSIIPRHVFVMDIVYAPPQTRFLAECAAAGLRTTNGFDMMYHQGAASFRLWAGQDMPLDYVREHMDDDSD